ncbi:MAG TPA: riboflavin synthase [bacterium]|nr:riboflavin synthase [bacterium]
MFTGIVEGMAQVREMRRDGRGARLVIDAGTAFDGEPLRAGDSVAVNGVCLTAVTFEGGAFAADLSAETLARTTLGRLAPGTAVNLERPVPVTGRLGGHIVQGHVDGVGRVVALREAGGAPDGEAEARRLEIAAPPDLARYIVEKGSVAVDGVSLTVAGVRGNRFGVALIPHTCDVTTLGSLEPGREVNLEVDILAKYVERLAGGMRRRRKAVRK